MSENKEAPQLWVVSSPNDGYLVGIMIASSEQEARDRGWQALLEQRPDGEHLNYHTDASELHVQAFGQEYWGADGEGHLELW